MPTAVTAYCLSARASQYRWDKDLPQDFNYRNPPNHAGGSTWSKIRDRDDWPMFDEKLRLKEEEGWTRFDYKQVQVGDERLFVAGGCCVVMPARSHRFARICSIQTRRTSRMGTLTLELLSAFNPA